MLNYHLHKIFVLSLFLPTRQQVFGQGHPQSGLLISNELLESCRLALAVEQAGLDVWSNWDLVVCSLQLDLFSTSPLTRADDDGSLLVPHRSGRDIQGSAER